MGVEMYSFYIFLAICNVDSFLVLMIFSQFIKKFFKELENVPVLVQNFSD